jgi:hypothetical protein
LTSKTFNCGPRAHDGKGDAIYHVDDGRNLIADTAGLTESRTATRVNENFNSTNDGDGSFDDGAVTVVDLGILLAAVDPCS